MNKIPEVHLKSYDKLLLCILISIFIIYIGGTFFLGSATFVDVLRGYVSMEQFLNGESFNTLNYELSSGRISYFVAWWTPGQYVLPFALKGLGMSIAAAQAILISLFIGVSIIGYLRLFRFLNFSPTISLLSILLIVTNHLFFWNSLMYFGGSLFELALLPWFLLFLLRIKSFTYKTGLAYFLIAISLFFLKATFLMHAGIGLGVLLLDFKTRKISELVTIALTGLSILAVCYFSFLQFGETPSSAIDNTTYNGIPNNILNDIFTPFASVTGIPFAVGILIQKMTPYFSWAEYLGYMIMPILSLLTGLLFWKMWKRWNAERKLVQFATVFFMVFILLFMLNRAVSYDYRHFAPLAFVFVPFLLKEIKAILTKGVLFKSFVYLLLAFNLFSFVLKRFDVWVSTEEINGIAYADSEHSIIDLYSRGADEVKIPNDARYFVINEWNVVPFFKNKQITPVELVGDQWFLSSGIELDNKNEIDLQKEIKSKQSVVLIYSHRDAQRLMNIINEEYLECIAVSRTHSVLLRR